MGCDEWLLETSGERQGPVLRFFGWDPPTLSIGRAQPLDRHVDLERCRRKGVPVIRRMTGGKAVYHDRELTYSIIGSSGCFPFDGNLLSSYRIIALGFLKAFRGMGIDVRMAEPRPGSSGGAVTSCFAQPSAYEILAADRKILGSAQKRTRNGVLQHGSLLLDYRHADWLELMKRRGDESADRVTSILRETGHIPPVDALMTTIREGFAQSHGIQFEPLLVTDEDAVRIEHLASGGYPDLSFPDGCERLDTI